MAAPLRRWRRPPSPPGRDALLAGVRNLEPSAWRLLFDQAYPVLSTYAMLRLGGADEAGDAIRDAMLRAVEVLPSSRQGGDALRAELLAFVAERIDFVTRFQMGPDPAVAARLPDEGRRGRHAFWALPSCEQDLLALLAAGATLEQAASAIRWSPPVAARSVSSACSLLAPGVPLAQVIERLRASFPGRPWEPKLEDQQALRAAVVAVRNRRRRHRRLGSAVVVAGAVVLLAASLAGGVLPKPLRIAARSAGLPVRSPLVVDVEQDAAGLSEALLRGDVPSVDMATRTLAAAFDALDTGERGQVQIDIEVELLRARQFLDSRRAVSAGRSPPANLVPAPTRRG